MSDIEYTIAAIPTVYRGRQYRSRLEAKWASFFDALRWRAEYEPFDLGKWSPDFLVRVGSETWLFEVKPITELHKETADRMVAAAGRAISTISGIALCGTSPHLEAEGVVRLGWVNPIIDGDFAGWRANYLAWVRIKSAPILVPIFCRKDVVLDQSDPDLFPYPEFNVRCWNEAANRVQWDASK